MYNFSPLSFSKMHGYPHCTRQKSIHKGSVIAMNEVCVKILGTSATLKVVKPSKMNINGTYDGDSVVQQALPEYDDVQDFVHVNFLEDR